MPGVPSSVFVLESAKVCLIEVCAGGWGGGTVKFKIIPVAKEFLPTPKITQIERG